MGHRSLNIRELYGKEFDTLPLRGIWWEVMGEPESSGIWLIYGAEKQGKTWFSLMLAQYLSNLRKTLYISAEEGTGKAFVESCRRAGIGPDSKLGFMEYLPLEELDAKLAKRRAAKVVFLDNVTVYADELKNGGLRRIVRKHPNKLFVFIAHEERNEPYTATAKMARKLASIITRVQGLACTVSGRCPGGTLMVDADKASLYHGNKISTNDTDATDSKDFQNREA